MFGNSAETTRTEKTNEKAILARHVGDRIRLAREHKGLSQERLAEILGFGAHGQKTISKWESGEALPKTENIPKLAKALSVTFTWLFTGSGAMEQDLTLRDIGNLLFHVIPANFNCSFSLSPNIYGTDTPSCKFDVDEPPTINYKIEIPYIRERGEDYPTGACYVSPLFVGFAESIECANKLKALERSNPEFIAPDAYSKLLEPIPDTPLSQLARQQAGAFTPFFMK
jgi:DNA-binding transcriptional regulator YiaG